LLVAAGLGTAPEHALISLLAINGLRISEAPGADIDHLGLEGGHRTLTVLRKGGKLVTIPLAPRTARAIDLAAGERVDEPIFLRCRRATHGPALRRVHRLPHRHRQDRPTTHCGTRSSPARSTPAYPCATCKKPPHTQTRPEGAPYSREPRRVECTIGSAVAPTPPEPCAHMPLTDTLEDRLSASSLAGYGVSGSCAAG
jgi:hypothetical protein